MKLIKLVALGALFSAPAFSQATSSNVLFDVESHCQARETTTGTRYVNCALPKESISLASVVSGGSVDQTLAAGTQIGYRFKCESLRPFAFYYHISSQGSVVGYGKLVAEDSDSDMTGNIILPVDAVDPQLSIFTAEGLYGFQAFKPGCQLQVGELSETAVDIDSLTILKHTLSAMHKVTDSIGQSATEDEFYNNVQQGQNLVLAVAPFVALTQDTRAIERLNALLMLLNTQIIDCIANGCNLQNRLDFEQQAAALDTELEEINAVIDVHVDYDDETGSDSE